jgi:antimicrobial peptide system SdpA family protein
MFNTTLLVPEGWAFFTRNPREPDIVLYKKIKGQWMHDPINPLSMISNWWGLDRRPRAQSTEMAMILHSIPQDLWVSCDSSIENCLTNFTDSVILQINNTVPRPVLCDTVAVQLLPPVPWAWSKNRNLVMPYRLIYIKVNCK